MPNVPIRHPGDAQQTGAPVIVPGKFARFPIANVNAKRLLHARLLAEILLRKTVVKRLELLDLLLHYKPRFVDLGGEVKERFLIDIWGY